jgi:hypothetical protein
MMSDIFGESPRGRRVRKSEEVEMDAPASVPRSEMRPEMREESPMERAKRRAAEIMDHRGTLDEGHDDFYIDPDMVPEGWTYEWKRLLLLGKEDPTYTVQLARAGWEAVPWNRCPKHRSYMPSDWSKNTIERKGMILMERPTEVVEMARSLEHRAARDQVRSKEAQLAGTPDGTLTRDHEKVRPSIKKGWEAMPVPKD